MEENEEFIEKTAENQKKQPKKVFKPSLLVLIILLVIIIVFSYRFIRKYQQKTGFEADYYRQAELNEKEIWKISKIYCYTSASAEANKTNQPQWDLSISSYTDISINLNTTNSQDGLTEENTIAKMSIYDIAISNNEDRNTSLYFKDLSQFGKADYTEENKIEGSLNYEVINSHGLDYSKPQIYLGANNPIALQLVHKNLKEHYILQNTDNPIIFDGHLLKQANIPLSKLNQNLSFKLQIINQLNQEFIANVSIPFDFENTEKSIYDGYCIHEFLNPNITFIRIK